MDCPICSVFTVDMAAHVEALHVDVSPIRLFTALLDSNRCDRCSAVMLDEDDHRLMHEQVDAIAEHVLVSCDKCGLIVTDRDTHDTWHRSLTDAVISIGDGLNTLKNGLVDVGDEYASLLEEVDRVRAGQADMEATLETVGEGSDPMTETRLNDLDHHLGAVLDAVAKLREQQEALERWAANLEGTTAVSGGGTIPVHTHTWSAPALHVSHSHGHTGMAAGAPPYASGGIIPAPSVAYGPGYTGEPDEPEMVLPLTSVPDTGLPTGLTAGWVDGDWEHDGDSIIFTAPDGAGRVRLPGAILTNPAAYGILRVGDRGWFQRGATRVPYTVNGTSESPRLQIGLVWGADGEPEKLDVFWSPTLKSWEDRDGHRWTVQSTGTGEVGHFPVPETEPVHKMPKTKRDVPFGWVLHKNGHTISKVAANGELLVSELPTEDDLGDEDD